MEIVEKVRVLASNLLEDKGIEMIDISYRREGPKMVLRLILDKKEGITLDECGWVNEKLGEILDKEDIISDSYILECSSPGLDRLLRTRKDFERVIGKSVKINTYGPVEEKREHIGKVTACDDESVTVELKNTALARKIPLIKIASARLEIEF
ncbi:MAG: ribosome maturation factor RimP [Candidatus Omnitrophica bacterium]|nr:ribosome maturation factor RimP [Candidatus Omnitrophota bacterium]